MGLLPPKDIDGLSRAELKTWCSSFLSVVGVAANDGRPADEIARRIGGAAVTEHETK